MTQNEFDNLPEWIRPGTVRRLVEVSEHELRVMRCCIDGFAVKLDGCLHWRYSKREVARLLRLHYSGPLESSGHSEKSGNDHTT